MVSYEALTAADPGTWEAQAARWAQLSQALEARAGDLAVRYQPLHTSWVGRDADAAAAHVEVLRKALLGHADRLEAGAKALSLQASNVRDAQWRLNMVMLAKPSCLVVDRDGTVRIDPVHQLGETLPPSQALLDGFAADLGRIVADATAADERSTAELARIRPAPDPAFAAVTTAAAATPPPGANPRQTSDWWRSLDSHTQEAILFEHPDTIAGLDGIPATIRDRANRSMLAQRRSEIDAKIADINCTVLPADRAAAIKPLQDQKDAIAAIDRRLHPVPDGTVQERAYLLGLDTSGDGHAIVAIGDPDHADNVVTSVPGTFAALGGVDGEIRHAELVVDSARLADPSQKTSAIAWIGYDAPQSLGPIGGAGSATYAEHAETRLAGFQDGLRATHEGPPSHNTVLGHSYGTTVVGMTARDHSGLADDIVFVGSPGVGVNHATDLHLDGTHVWASRALNDIIAVAISPEELPKYLPGTGTIAEALDPTRHARYGTDPTDSHFGGQVFHSEFRHLNPVDAHSQYWDRNSDSLRNLGRIAVGRTDVSR